MKSKVSWLIVGLAVALAATGCKTPQNQKTIYGYKQKTHDEPPSPPIETPPPVTPPTEPEAVPIWSGSFSNMVADESAFADQTIYFTFDSATIKNAEKSKALVVAAFLQSNPKDDVRITGNCDERGTEEYNRALGERRALAAREALLGAGITPDRIDIISYGEDKPVDPGHNEAAWKQNRRAAFILLKPPQ